MLDTEKFLSTYTPGWQRAAGSLNWGMRHATVLDPDGNGIDVHAGLPAGRPKDSAE